MQRVIIVGGGISGLSAAYFLEQFAAQAGMELSIHLMERSGRLGGVILTERVGDFLLEGGPDSFLSQKPAAIELCRALHLSDQLIPSNDDQRKTYVLIRGKLRELPEGLMFVVPTRLWPVFRSDLLSVRGKVRLALSPFLPPPSDRERDVSVTDFISQRFGEEVLERLAEPLLAAVYGADVDSLSARAVFPQLLALEEKHGSLWRALSHAHPAPGGDQQPSRPQGLFMTLRNGVGHLITALEQSLTRTQIVTHHHARQLHRDREGAGFRVGWQGEEMEATAVILATPAHAAARLLQDLDAGLAAKLAEIPYHSSLIVSLAFEERAIRRKLDGFGFVVPRREGKSLIACTWVSTKFPFRSAPGGVLLRCFLGGARNPSILQETDERILNAARRELAEIIEIQASPTLARIYRWEQCMPQYDVGHLNRLEAISSLLAGQPGLFLSGNGYRGVGIPDCIQASSLAAAAALEYLKAKR